MSELSKKYVLVGGGLASLNAAIAIRERDEEGSVLIVCGEDHPPYDRPPVSKAALTKDGFADDDAYSKFDSFYPDKRIELILGTRATRLDPASGLVDLEDGRSISYEKALIATGATPRGCDMPGCDLPGVFFLRSLADAFYLREALAERPNVAVVGAGYLGIEVAAACIGRGLRTTVLAPGSHPWPLFASERLGQFVKSQLEAQGVEFALGREMIGVAGTARAEAVATDAGTTPAQCVIVCVGASLDTGLADKAGLAMAEDGGIVVDASLKSSAPGVWAAGDVAHFEDLALGKSWHAEHFLNARWQGRVAGANMAGASETYDKVPYFYSDFLDLHMIQRGDPDVRGDSALFGSLDAGEFVELYFDGAGAVRMGIAISRDEPSLDPISDTLEEMVRKRQNVRDARAERFGF